ncbi:MAG TPA: hypothetical protein VMY18_12890 [Acidobacteriota bacterium]|nr:hypothetical protein [Acidobacteriota bacterium]
MTKLQVIVASLLWTLIASPVLCAGDLSRYREFGLNSNLAEVARQTGTTPEKAKIIHERPALIQELTWQPGSDDAVKEIQFSFYDSELFRMMIHYNRYTTEGLTAQDVIEATSMVYGEALKPTDEITFSKQYGRDETVEVIARWEDEDWSFNLVQFKYEPSFTLAVFSKHLDGLARTAINEAIELDREEAPQRKINQKKEDDIAKAADQETARLASKLHFRP